MYVFDKVVSLRLLYPNAPWEQAPHLYLGRFKDGTSLRCMCKQSASKEHESTLEKGSLSITFRLLWLFEVLRSSFFFLLSLSLYIYLSLFLCLLSFYISLYLSPLLCAHAANKKERVDSLGCGDVLAVPSPPQTRSTSPG